MAKAVTNSLPHRPPFFSVFQKWLCEAYRRFGTETSPVVSLNYLLPIGKSWWRCSLCCAVSCGHLLRCSRWIWSRRPPARGNTVCSVTSLTLRYIVGKIGRLSLQLAKTVRHDIINSIRENKLTFKNRNNGMRRWDALDNWDSSCENKFARGKICFTLLSKP